jgi:ATP-binding cassette, subfamily C, bacterial CydCD
MRVVDSRLTRYARATRVYLALSVLLGCLTALFVVAQAWSLADVVTGAFAGRKTLTQFYNPLLVLFLVVVRRAGVAWWSARAAHRASARAKSELRSALVRHVASTSPVELREGMGGLAIVAIRGIDALDNYFSRYLPQVLLAVIVPLTVLAVVAGSHWISAAIIAVTLPLVPLFMALVGANTRARTEREVHTLERLAGAFLDLVAGLPTLKVFGRAKAQAKAIGVSFEFRGKVQNAKWQKGWMWSITIGSALIPLLIGVALGDLLHGLPINKHHE